MSKDQQGSGFNVKMYSAVISINKYNSLEL